MGMKDFIAARKQAEPFPRDQIRDLLQTTLAARRQVTAALDDAKVHQCAEDCPGGADAMEITIQGLAALERQLENAATSLKAAVATIDQVAQSESALETHALRMLAAHRPDQLTGEEFARATGQDKSGAGPTAKT